MKESPHKTISHPFAAALLRMQIPLRAGLRRRGIPDGLLDDVVQDTLLRALEAQEHFDSSRPLLPWLLVIGLRRGRDVMNRRGEEALGGLEPHAPPSQMAILQEDRSRLRAALRRLSRRDRRVLRLYYEDQRPLGEMARELKAPLQTTKSWLHRAREALAREMGGRR